jgi:hypothetical protein
MTSSRRLVELFEDVGLVEKIQRKLPYLFHLAEQESARGGRVGMEVGSKREQILVALLIYKFGEENVNTSVPITMPERARFHQDYHRLRWREGRLDGGLGKG